MNQIKTSIISSDEISLITLGVSGERKSRGIEFRIFIDNISISTGL
jgi:hypothetical protein